MTKNISIKHLLIVIIPLLIIDIFNAFYLMGKTYGGFDAMANGNVSLRDNADILAFFILPHIIVLSVGVMIVMWLSKDVFYLKLAITRMIILSLLIPLWLVAVGFKGSSDEAVRVTQVFDLITLAKAVFYWIPFGSYLLIIPLVVLHQKKQLN